MTPTPTTAIDAETMAKGTPDTTAGYGSDFELIDAFSRAVQNYAASLYRQSNVVWSDVKFENAWEDRDTVWADLEMRFNNLRQAADRAEAKADHFLSHFSKLAKINPAANAALDTARREWAKRGEG